MTPFMMPTQGSLEPEIGGERDQRSASSTAAHRSGKHDLVVAGERDAAPARRGRPRDDVHARAVVADEVHVDGGETPHWPADVPRQVERLHEHLGQDHGRAQVEIDAAVETADHAGEQTEVAQAARADGRAVGVGMHVDDVGADRDVHGGGNAGARRGGEDAGAPMRQPGRLDGVADRRARGPCPRRRPRWSRGSGTRRSRAPCRRGRGRGQVRRPPTSSAAPRQLEVVDQAGAVHGDGGQAPALDQIDDQRPEPHLDGVRAHAEDDGLAARAMARAMRAAASRRSRAAEDVGQPVEPRAHAEPAAYRLAERGSPPPCWVAARAAPYGCGAGRSAVGWPRRRFTPAPPVPSHRTVACPRHSVPPTSPAGRLRESRAGARRAPDTWCRPG